MQYVHIVCFDKACFAGIGQDGVGAQSSRYKCAQVDTDAAMSVDGYSRVGYKPRQAVEDL